MPYFIFETLYTLFDYYMQGLDRLDFTYFYPLDPVVPVQHDAVENASAVPADAQIPARRLFRDVHLTRVLDRCRLLREHFAHAVLPALFSSDMFSKGMAGCYQGPPFQALSIALLAGGFVLLYMLSPILDASWFYGAMPYLEFGLDSWYAGFYRAITYAFTVIMGLCVLSHIPESDTPFTDRGVNTMYVFLLHGFIVKTMRHLNWFETFRSTGGKVLLILFGVLLTWLLSSSWIKRGFGWIVEPNVGFLFNYRSKHRQERVESKHSNAKG